jgi:hypothetical protein
LNAFSVDRTRLRTLVLAAALAWAAPLAAQDVPPAPTLLRVAAAADGTVLSLDSAATARAADSVFVVNAVYHFAPDTARHGVDGRMDLQAMDCGRTLLRGRTSTWFAGNLPVSTPGEQAPNAAGWQPVAEGEVSIFQAICGYLLGSFAASLPVTVEAMTLDAPPELANQDDVARTLMRSYPAGLPNPGAGGVAMIRMWITAEGRVDPASTRILWATSPSFAVAAARVPPRSRWRPARVNGQPVAAWAILPMAFHLSP